MKYELTEKETLAMLRIAERIVGIAERMVEARTSPKMADVLNTALAHMVARDARDAADDAAVADDEDNDDNGEDAEPAPAPNVTPFPAAVPAAATPAMSPEAVAAAAKAEELRVQRLHGKDLWIALIEVWRQGFMVEGAQQPDRVANLNAAMSPNVMAYIRSKAGITDATREAIYLLDGGDPEGDYRTGINAAQRREARLIAENIAQVASFHAPWFTEQLEYSYDFRTIPQEL